MTEQRLRMDILLTPYTNRQRRLNLFATEAYPLLVTYCRVSCLWLKVPICCNNYLVLSSTIAIFFYYHYSFLLSATLFYY